MFISTYRRDYVTPYPWTGKPRHKLDWCKEMILPPPPKPRPPIDKTAEWTGTEPMGRLVKPLLLPMTLRDDQIDVFVDEDKPVDPKDLPDVPNPFLSDLQITYPDLYYRLDGMALSASHRRPVLPCGTSTYHSSYNVTTYVPGSGYPLPKARKRDPIPLEVCDEYRMDILNDLAKHKANNQIACLKRKGPFNPFKQSRDVKSSGKMPWPARVTIPINNYTEYMDTINKSGCIIKKNNLHDHTLCLKGRSCRHPIEHACTYLKRKPKIDYGSDIDEC